MGSCFSTRTLLLGKFFFRTTRCIQSIGFEYMRGATTMLKGVWMTQG